MVHISELHDWLSRNSEAEEYNVTRQQVNPNQKNWVAFSKIP